MPAPGLSGRALLHGFVQQSCPFIWLLVTLGVSHICDCMHYKLLAVLFQQVCVGLPMFLFLLCFWSHG